MGNFLGTISPILKNTYLTQSNRQVLEGNTHKIEIFLVSDLYNLCNDKTNAVRRYISSNNQIISNGDLKSFGELELRGMAKEIKIMGSTMEGEHGLRKCILVSIKIDKSVSNNENLQILRKSLKIILK